MRTTKHPTKIIQATDIFDKIKRQSFLQVRFSALAGALPAPQTGPLAPYFGPPAHPICHRA
jgi:hypothetical protein